MSLYVIPENILHLGLDHLEGYGKFFDESRFDGIDFDNSNEGTLGEYTFTKHEVPKYLYKIMFTRDDTSLFAYYKGKTTGSVTTHDYFCFYSGIFRTHTIEEVVNILYTYFLPRGYDPRKSEEKQLSFLRRFDVCIDIRESIEKIISFFGASEQKGATFRGEKGVLETLYIGEKKKNQNKRQLLRIYDKKKDIMAKRKDSLYFDYLLERDVTRLELEVRRELAANYTFAELVIPENLLGLLKNYFRKHTNIFSKIDTDEISLYKERGVTFGMIQANAEGRRIVSTYLGWSRNMLKRGICPFYLLLHKDIKHEDMRKLFSETPGFDSIIEKLGRDHHVWKELVESIRNGENAPD